MANEDSFEHLDKVRLITNDGPEMRVYKVSHRDEEVTCFWFDKNLTFNKAAFRTESLVKIDEKKTWQLPPVS